MAQEPGISYKNVLMLPQPLMVTWSAAENKLDSDCMGILCSFCIAIRIYFILFEKSNVSSIVFSLYFSSTYNLILAIVRMIC